MNVGDLVVSRIHHRPYRGLYFIVTRMINYNNYDKRTLIKCFSGAYQTSWCDAANWEVVSEDR